jgi:hypothetical protein
VSVEPDRKKAAVNEKAKFAVIGRRMQRDTSDALCAEVVLEVLEARIRALPKLATCTRAAMRNQGSSAETWRAASQHSSTRPARFCRLGPIGPHTAAPPQDAHFRPVRPAENPRTVRKPWGSGTAARPGLHGMLGLVLSRYSETSSVFHWPIGPRAPRLPRQTWHPRTNVDLCIGTLVEAIT